MARQGLFIENVMEKALATGLFVSTCTIYSLPSPITLGPSGSPTDAYVAVTGLQNIRCMKAVQYPMQSPKAEEHKGTGQVTTTSEEWHILLETYYPTIDTSMRCTVDGVWYDIRAVDCDSQFQMTRLDCGLVAM